MMESWKYSASVICNVSKLDEGRKVIAKPEAKILEDLVELLRSDCDVVKAGISGCLRNICSDSELIPRVVLDISGIRSMLECLSDPNSEYSFEEKVALSPSVWSREENGNCKHIIGREAKRNLVPILASHLLR
mmetsp:Transcript_6147/g.8668  ORF Transcript_6147/g.8668 Transcript_6147/m.8668 type:complete len:133 (+) Transcript_6147:3-401(+)